MGGRKGLLTDVTGLVNMLDLWISKRAEEITGGRQTPTTAKPETVPDFPVALVQ